MSAEPEPSVAEFVNWRRLVAALRRAAEYPMADASGRARMIAEHAADELFANFLPSAADQRKRGREIQKQLVAGVRRFRPSMRGLHPRNYEGQALLCWYVRVVDPTPSDRRVAEAVGKNPAYLLQTWGDTPSARQKTVRARMWTGASARTTATKKAWPGIARLIAELESRLGPFAVTGDQVEQPRVDGVGAPRPVDATDPVSEVMLGIRRAGGRHRKGQTDIRFLRWQQHVDVDRLGNSSHLIKTTVMGKNQQPVTQLYFSVYYDGSARPFADYRIGRSRRWQGVAAEWDPELGGGRFKIPIPALANGATLPLQYRYRLPDVYREGAESFEWFFAAEHEKYKLAISFAPEWHISDVQVSCPEGTTRPLPDASVDDNTLTWSMDYPELARRYRFDWKMTRADSAK